MLICIPKVTVSQHIKAAQAVAEKHAVEAAVLNVLATDGCTEYLEQICYKIKTYVIKSHLKCSEMWNQSSLLIICICFNGPCLNSVFLYRIEQC